MTEETTLDYLEPIRVPGLVFNEPANEYWQLQRLWMGMEYLYKQAKAFDAEIVSKLQPGVERFQFGGGTPPMLENAFDWYAISACRFVRLVGEIARRCDTARQENGKEYARRVIPDVEVYRDKVAAHFAWSTENRRDNDAERIVSVLPQITFGHETYWAAGLTLYKRSGDKSSTSEALQPWSISKTHEVLQKRYLPPNSEPQQATVDESRQAVEQPTT